MADDQKNYEIFLSYARKDNQPIPVDYPHGWVTALRDEILREYRGYSTEPLEIFFDKHEIKDIDDWRHRIQGALRHSKILIVCLSQAYNVSPNCQWEWDDYRARQSTQALAMGHDTHAVVYFVEVPKSPEQPHAPWIVEILRGNTTDFRPWFPTGAAAIAEAAVQQKITALGNSIHERLDRARRAMLVPSNLRQMTPFFVGRKTELRELHEKVGLGTIGIITAVTAFGGLGKTELAVAYARLFTETYPLGIWELKAEGKKELLPMIGEIAAAPEFRYALSEEAKKDAELAGREVLDELRRRATEWSQTSNIVPAVLFILDNVTDLQLFSASQRAKVPAYPWLRILSTSRESPSQEALASKRVFNLDLPPLDDDTAYRLLCEHQTTRDFANDQDRADARELARQLGGFTLAIEQVAIHLGLNDVRPGEYLAQLVASGLPSVDVLGQDAEVAAGMLHQTKQLKPIIDSMLVGLPPEAIVLLKFAAHLPPDTIPWPWLESLTSSVFPSQTLDFRRIKRLVEGRRFLTPGDREQYHRMHRLIASHLAEDVYLPVVNDYVASSAQAIHQSQNVPEDWELDALLVAIPHGLEKRPNHKLANDGTFLVDKVLGYRTVSAARTLLNTCSLCLQKLATNDPNNAQLQRNLSISFNKLGDVAQQSGDLNAALGYFTQALNTAQKLATNDSTNAELQRDLSVSFNKLGDVAQQSGDLNAALGYFTQALNTAQKLATTDPTNAELQRDLSVSFERLGDVARQSGDLNAALGYFTQTLNIAQKIATTDPTNAQLQRDLSISFNKLGDVAQQSGDLNAALRYFTQDLNIAQKLATNDPTNAQLQRDLSISFNKLGDVAQQSGDLNAALGYFTQALNIRQKLATNDPTNAQLQRDLSISFDKLGDVAQQSGDLNAALRYFTQALNIAQKLATNDPTNAQLQRDLSISFNKLGDIAQQSGDLNAALGYFTQALNIAQKLATNDPTNAEKQRDIAVSAFKLFQLATQAGDDDDASEWLGQCHQILTSMKARGMHLDPPMARLLAQLDDAFKK
jgi:Flp pilus assembly protein TadD